MICPGYSEKPQSYKNFKKEHFKKYVNKANHMRSMIDCCSLKGDDKRKLKSVIIEILKKE